MAAIVADFGTSTTRIGVAGEAGPSFEQTRSAAGAAVVWDSRFRDYDQMDLLFERSGLIMQGSTTDVLMAESIAELDPLHFRMRVCEHLFEKHNSRSVCFQYAPVLSCFANARQTGLVVDLSGGGCTVTAVQDGWCTSDGNVERSDLGGEDLDSFLSKVENGPVLSVDNFSKLSAARTSRESETFTLPDGTPIATFIRGLLFDPTPMNEPASYVPLHELVFTAAMKQSASTEVRRSLMNNVVVCGGLSRTEGLVRQLTEELNTLAKMHHPRLIACAIQQRNLTTWIGGSILASLPVFKEIGISRTEFEESGQQIVIKKFA